ncbi:PAS domain-containing protein [Hydrogenophaga sp.]|uniref:PAS domain-containing protein n=1 Tax=Hydrogenophaga sp. TaxID=1904254 RepID=UPI00260243FC|nr:PAS domain-containing protein [Hydrogenophaga sp.]
MEKSADVETTSAAERALRISERRYRRLFEAAFDGILLLNAETAQIEDVNPYLVKLLGYSREEFLGKKVWELGAFKDTALSKQAFAELQEDHFIRYEDLPLETKDGRRIAVEFVSNVYLVEDLRVNRLSGGRICIDLGRAVRPQGGGASNV